MNKYESVIIIKPNLEDGEIEGIITEITDLINQDGKITGKIYHILTQLKMTNCHL